MQIPFTYMETYIPIYQWMYDPKNIIQEMEESTNELNNCKVFECPYMSRQLNYALDHYLFSLTTNIITWMPYNINLK